MHTKALIVGALAASCSLVAAQDAAPLVGRDDPTHTKKHNRHEDPALQTVEPSKLSAYHSDMHSLRSKIKVNLNAFGRNPDQGLILTCSRPTLCTHP